MDSRDVLILGAVAVAAFWWWRNRNTVTLPAGPAGPGVGAMTQSGAATTSGAGPATTSQVGAPTMRSFGGFSAVNMSPFRFAAATVSSVVNDLVDPVPVTRPPVVNSPTVLGGAGVYSSGAGAMGPQPFPSTRIINPARY